MLSLGAALLGASHVVAVDVDAGALDLCHENRDSLECSAVRKHGRWACS